MSDMKYAPYSFSKLSLHEQCNRKFKYRYIDKVKPQKQDMTALLKGGAVHSLLENYPNPSTHKLAPKYKHIFDDFLQTKLGQDYLNIPSIREFAFGLTKDFEPTEYKSKDAIFRGYVDYICTKDNVLHLIDWKTGRLKEQKWQSYDQLMMYAIYFFQRYPNIDQIKISYVYVEHAEAENDLLLERKYLRTYKDSLAGMIISTEQDIEFKKCPSKLCDYCEFQYHCDKD